MKKHDFHDALKAAIPDASLSFGFALRKTIAGFAQPEGEKEGPMPMKPVISKRRALTVVLAAMLAVAAVATAAALIARNVFDVTMGDTPANAASLTHYNLAKERIGDAEIAIREAAYDGMTLYILYSIRDLTATQPLGAFDAQTGERLLRSEDYDRIDKLGVGWWWDSLWIDGEPVSMPNMSSFEDLPGEEPGEIRYYAQYRLDQAGVFLYSESTEIALPIGERQPMAVLTITQEPYHVAKPQKGMVTFHMDCSNRDQVIAKTPDIPTDAGQWRAKVSRVVYSPIQLYVTLDWEIKPDVLRDYIAENGDGYYENGVKYWDYDGLAVCGSEIMSMTLVDGNGKPMFETLQGFYGCKGAGNTEAWYTFPYAEKYPDTMYLAPEIGGELDMTKAVRVR